MRLSRNAIVPVSAFALGVLALAIHLPWLSAPLTEVHPFRQTNNAWTALVYHAQGIDLFHPFVPVLGAPWQVVFEFPLQQALAALIMNVGLSTDSAMRLVTLVTFTATATLLFVLMRDLVGRVAALVAVAAFLFSPFALLEGGTASIEYLAVGAALGYAYMTLRWAESRRTLIYVVAFGLGVVAMLVKGPTAVVYFPAVLVAAASVDLRRVLAERRVGTVVAVLALIIVPGAIGLAWTNYADSIKAAGEFTANFTQAKLVSWYFGTLGQRFDVATWAQVLIRNNFMLLGGLAFVYVPLAAITAWKLDKWRRAFLLSLAVGGVIGLIVFTNMYFIHPYYFAALSPIIAVAIGLTGQWLWERRERLWAKGAAALLIAAWVISLVATGRYWLGSFRDVSDPEYELVAANFIASHSAPGEIVVVTGRDWDPAALYYADRWGLMFVGGVQQSLDRALRPEMRQHLIDLGYRQLFHCPAGDPQGCTMVVDLTAAATGQHFATLSE